MITWLQTTFGKHHRLLFGALLTVIICTFVLAFSPSGGAFTKQDSGVSKKLFYGFDLTSRGEMEKVEQGAMLSGALNPNDARILRQREDYKYARMVGIGLANQYGVPTPSNKQIEDYLKSRSSFQNEKGEFDQSMLTRFMDMIKESGQFKEEDVMDTLIDDWRIEQIAKTLSGPGYIMPYEVSLRLSEEESIWTVVHATVDYSAYKPEITPDDAAVQAFFDSNPNRYEEPEKIKLKAVEFPSANYLPQVADADEVALRTYFETNKRRFMKPPAPPAEGEEPKPPVEPTFEESRDEVVKQLKDEEARKLASSAADDFSVKLFRDGIKNGSPAFNTMIQDSGSVLTEIPAFSKNQPMPLYQMGLYRQAASAFNLDEENYHSDATTTPNGAVVLIFESKSAPRLPAFDEVKDRVTTDYKEEERRKSFTDHGKEIKASIEQAIVGGKTFEEAAKEQGLETKLHENFKGADVPQEMRQDGSFMQATSLEPGQMSDMIFKGPKGTFVYLSSKVLPEVNKEAPETAKKIKEMNDEMAMADGWIVLSELAGKEMKKLSPPKEEATN